MEPTMSDEEIRMMGSSKSEWEWKANCDKVKAAHGGNYPDDWFAKVMVSGLGAATAAKFGRTVDIKISTIQ